RPRAHCEHKWRHGTVAPAFTYWHKYARAGAPDRTLIGYSPIQSESDTYMPLRPRLALAQTLHAQVSQGVVALVARVAGVTAHPSPRDRMAGHLIVQGLPQLVVLHRLLVGGQTAAPLPVGQPVGYAFHDVLRIGVDHHPSRP